jgi:hypothetical protein
MIQCHDYMTFEKQYHSTHLGKCGGHSVSTFGIYNRSVQDCFQSNRQESKGKVYVMLLTAKNLGQNIPIESDPMQAKRVQRRIILKGILEQWSVKL